MKIIRAHTLRGRLLGMQWPPKHGTKKPMLWHAGSHGANKHARLRAIVPRKRWTVASHLDSEETLMTLTRDTNCQGGCGKVRSVLCSDSPADWLCDDCRKKRTHYIAISGASGCLPDSCNAYETYQDAVDALTDLFDLGRTRKARLFANNILKLSPRDGADYCEIQTCNCSKPWEHCDAGNDPRDWPEYQR